MEILIGLMLVGAVLWFIGRRRRPTSKRRVRQQPASRPAVAPPDQPAVGRLIRLSGDGRVSVVGESHYQDALRAAANGRASGPGLDGNLPAAAVLIPEPRNRHDRNAVRVDINRRTVGYLAREVAVDYQPVLNWLATRGETGWCAARITGGGQRNFGVYLHLGDPERLVPVNRPTDLEVLDAEAVITVTGEEHYQDALGSLLDATDRATIFVELRPGTTARGKHAGEPCVDVFLDDGPVGCLTAVMSTRYLPLVRAVTSTGRRVGAEASLYRDQKGVQLRLRLPSVAAA